jgi:two-component system, cell cycle sensor histidine kinase and response regulator CckA
MKLAPDLSESQPSELAAAHSQVRELKQMVEQLQLQMAELKTRRVRADELDSGLGSLRVEYETSLQEVERLAHVGSWQWDVRTNEVAWSEEFYRILGYDPAVDPATMDRFYATLHPDDCAMLRSHEPRVATTGITAPGLRVRVLRNDGSVRQVSLAGAPIRDQKGELIRIVGAALDVTEFVSVERDVQRTTQLLNEAQRIASLGSWNWVLETNRIEWSDTMYQIFNVAPGTVITNEVFFERVHPEDRERVRSSQACFIGRGAPLEYRVVWPDGSVRHAYMEVSSERDAEGHLVRVVGTVQDITARKQLEDQFRQAQKMEAIGTLAGGIAHDFNNYLLVIQGNVHLLKSSLPTGGGEKDLLGEIKSAVGSCASLTRQLLALARRQVSTPRVVDVGELVAGSTRLLRRLVGDHIELVLQAQAERHIVRMDPSHVEQVLVNLVVNARDAMPDGGVVSIQTARRNLSLEEAESLPALTPGEYVCLSVKDTGVGIPLAVQARIFEPFFTTKGHGKGTGLGLATVYGIAQQWKGHVEFQSTPGKGSEFRVWLPAHAGVADKLRDKEEALGVRGKETILLVEDEPQVRRLVRTVLEHAGYVVLVAEDGQDALRVAERALRIDLLLSDVRMPRLGGVQLARRLSSAWPRLKVLLMSGYPDVDAVALGESGFAEALLAKPFTTSELLERMRALLDQARSIPPPLAVASNG